MRAARRFITDVLAGQGELLAELRSPTCRCADPCRFSGRRVRALLPRRSDWTSGLHERRRNLIAGLDGGSCSSSARARVRGGIGTRRPGRVDYCDRRRGSGGNLRRFQPAGVGTDGRDDGGADSGGPSVRRERRADGRHARRRCARRCGVRWHGSGGSLSASARHRGIHRRYRRRHRVATGTGNARYSRHRRQGVAVSVSVTAQVPRPSTCWSTAHRLGCRDADPHRSPVAAGNTRVLGRRRFGDARRQPLRAARSSARLTSDRSDGSECELLRPAPASLPWIPSALAVAALGALGVAVVRCCCGRSYCRSTPRSRPRAVRQGIANLITPLFGGVPATGAIARTAVNARAGATSRLSALTHACRLRAAVVLVAAPLVGKIPVAALGGVLLATCIQMVEVGLAAGDQSGDSSRCLDVGRHLRHHGRGKFV